MVRTILGQGFIEGPAGNLRISNTLANWRERFFLALALNLALAPVGNYGSNEINASPSSKKLA